MKERGVDKALTYFENMTSCQKDEVVSTINAALLSKELGTGNWKNFMRVQANKTAGYEKSFYTVLAMFDKVNIEDFAVVYLDRLFDFKKRSICQELEKLAALNSIVIEQSHD